MPFQAVRLKSSHFKNFIQIHAMKLLAMKKARGANKKKGVAKKPAGAKCTKGLTMTPQAFKTLYYSCCPASTSLTYPEKGGRRGDLAIQCHPWVRASYNEDSGVFESVTPGDTRAGFLAIHAERMIAQEADKKKSGASQKTRRSAGPSRWQRECSRFCDTANKPRNQSRMTNTG